MEKETKKKSKIVDILETIFYTIFTLGFIVFIFLLLWRLGLKISILIVGSISIIVICLTVSIKKDEKKEKEYREKYITEKIIEDKIFGKIIFENYTPKNRLTCKQFNIPFGKYNPTIQIIDYIEDDKEIYLRSLEYVYGKQEEIIENLLEYFLDAYSNSKEVTPELLKENFDIESIAIGKIDFYNPEEIVIEVNGNPNKNKLFRNYYCGVTACINCKTKEIYYSSY